MSLHEYNQSKVIDSTPWEFYALIMAAMRKADDKNLDALGHAFPEILTELKARYNAPGGLLNGEHPTDN